MRILYVVNKKLPDGDYRLAYAHSSKVCKISYAMPEKPPNVDNTYYFRIGFDEGLRFRYFLDFLNLFRYLLIHRNDLDSVHYFSTNLILLGPLIAWLTRIPSLITITGFGRTFSSENPIYSVLRPLYWLLLRISVKVSRAVLFQNRGDLERLGERFPSLRRKMFYAGSAVSMPIIENKHFNEKLIKVLLIARLMPDKGIEDFLKVAESLNQGEFTFTLIGPHSVGYDHVQQNVLKCHKRGIINYTGELDAISTAEYLKKSHIFYFPSYGEGMSRVMLECGYSQVCPIAYDIPANRDLIASGRGFLVKPGDTNKVVEHLKRLSVNRNLLRENALCYQEHIVANYNMGSYTRRMDDILLSVLG